MYQLFKNVPMYNVYYQNDVQGYMSRAYGLPGQSRNRHKGILTMLEVNCEGCYVQDICIYSQDSKTCPCRICIIKMVCREICQPRANFRMGVEIKRRKELRKKIEIKRGNI